MIVLALLPSLFVASSIGEEIEERTITYLWSRPLPALDDHRRQARSRSRRSRWSSRSRLVPRDPGRQRARRRRWTIARVRRRRARDLDGRRRHRDARPSPRHGAAIIYLVILDIAIGAIPASLREIAVSYQVVSLARLREADAPLHAAIGLAVIGAVWMTIGMLRIRRSSRSSARATA